MNHTQVIKNIQTKAFPVCLCYGTDTFLMESFIHALSHSWLDAENQDMAFSKYDAREVSLSTILEDAQTVPFLISKKLIIVQHAYYFTASREGAKSESGGSKEEKQLEDLADYLANPAPYTLLLFRVHADKLDERKKIVKSMKNQQMAFSFFPLPHPELRIWIEQRTRQEQLQFTSGAIDALVAYTQSNLQMIQLEIDKLRTMLGPGGQVDEELIQQVVPRSLEDNIFILIDCVVNKQIDRALQLLNDLLKQKEEPIKIAMLLVRQFRIILQVKHLSMIGYSESNIASQISVAPYAVKVAQQQAKKYTFPQLMATIDYLADLDFHMKSGKIDKVLGLEMFFLKMVSGVASTASK